MITVTGELTFTGVSSLGDQETSLYYLQSRYYDPAMGRFLNADSSVSTGQGLIGNNMFTYCLNNPVNGCDPCGTCFHRLDFWNDCEECGGRTFGEKVDDTWENITTWCEDTYDRINGVYQQQQQLNNEMLMQQHKMIADTANAAWTIHVHSVELEAQRQYEQDMMVKNHWEDTFSSTTRFGDFATMTFTNCSAYATYVGLASAGTVTVGSVLFVAATIGFAAWSTLRYYNVIS